MDAANALRTVKLASARERIAALRAAIRRAEARSETVGGTTRLLAVLKSAVEALSERLARFEDDEDNQLLDYRQTETRVHYWTQHIPVLHSFLDLLDRSDHSSAPTELIGPLTDRLCKLLPGSEVILVADSSLNYSIVEIGGPLRRLLDELGVDPPRDFPQRVFRVAVPAVEHDQVLLHCILSHELGHPLSETFEIDKKLPSIKIDEQLLKEIYNLAKATSSDSEGQQQEFPFDELQFISLVSSRVNSTISNWIQELASDLFGLLCFGPAYLYAFIHFFSSAFRLDAASATHPPTRLRLKSLFKLLDAGYPSTRKEPAQADATIRQLVSSEYSDDGMRPSLEGSRGSHIGLSSPASDFLEGWRQIATEKIDIERGRMIEALAARTLMQEGLLDKLQSAAVSSYPKQHTYTATEYAEALRELCPLIDHCIPPVEVWRESNAACADPVSILNAGWEARILGLADFSQHLAPDDRRDPLALSRAFNSFLRKTIELNEAARLWSKATR